MSEDKKRILIVDDEQDICEIVKFNLECEGFDVSTANSAEEAFDIGVSDFDLLILDVMMDGISGFEMAKKIKKNSVTEDIPIMFLTAKTTENDTITGLSIGADDYMQKPFSIRELVLRVKSILRRSVKASEQDVIKYETMLVNISNKTLTIDGKSIDLTKTEYKLLTLLMSKPKHMFSRQELLEKVWGRDVVVLDRTIDVNITRLRKKLKAYSNTIASKSGFGYYFDDEKM